MRTLAVEGYRSLRSLVVGLDRLNVVTGANGAGKSSLYRALRLLADSARNGAVAALARKAGWSPRCGRDPSGSGGPCGKGCIPCRAPCGPRGSA